MTLYPEDSGSSHTVHTFHKPLSTTIPSQTSTFPKTSRFFDTSSLPDLKHLEVSNDEHHQALLNGQFSNFNYIPFNISQQKSKTSPPINYDLIPNKFYIVPSTSEDANEIPLLHLNEELAKKPMNLIDSLLEIGRQYGAVKVKLPAKHEALFQTCNQVNSDLFWFHTNKVLNNPSKDEVLARLKFYRDLLEFHQRDQHYHFEDSEGTKKKEKNGASNLQSHLSKLPMIDKRPLDLFKLYQSVIVRGGFIEVINKKLWAQIGRELGYKGKIMTSLSSSLKASYQKILYPYELYIANQRTVMVKEEHVIDTLLSNGKRNLQPSNTFDKKTKIGNRYDAPLIIGSAKQFKRQFKTKVAKGLLANSPHLIDVKQPNTFVVKQNDKKRNKKAADTVNAFITPQTSFQASLSYIQNHEDEPSSTEMPKTASSYTLRQFMEKDIKFQEYVIQQNKDSFRSEPGQRDCISFQELENLYWRYARNDCIQLVFSNGVELEMGKDLPSSIHGSGFVKLGDDVSNFKNALNNHQLSLSHAKQAINAKYPNTTPHGFSHQNPWEYNKINSIDQMIESALYPWNLHNFSTLPNAILGTLSESDIGNRELTGTRVNVGMTFSTENWTCEDHFTQLINYHFFGAPKRWYFIPESEFEKFEQLVKDVSENASSRSMLNRNKPIDVENFCAVMFRSNGDEMETDVLIKSLENSVNTKPDVKLQHGNTALAKLRQHEKLIYNQDLRITPELLNKHNIRYTTTVQNPGEFVIKFPKTYSSAQSYGFNFTEETNFASSLWLEHAIEGEKWLSKQGILPNFLIFKLLVTVATTYDNGTCISFNSEVFAKVAKLYEKLYVDEIKLRDQIRKLKIKETSVNDESLSDITADDDYSAVFPSRVILTEIKSKDSMIVSMESFLKYSDLPEFMEKYQVELQLFHSDEKLKNFHKILSGYSVDFESWIRNYQELMAGDGEVNLKQYKLLLNEGDRINSSILSTSVAGDQQFDQQRLKSFREYLDNLRFFTSGAVQFIEDCQNILSLKHQQRIRNGQESSQQERSYSFNELLSIVEKIPSLNISCPEIDQIIELKTEIENFDKASRTLISKKNRSPQEFDDLISLGESFGLDIPSLDFIIRIRDRLRWIKTYNLIEKGVDPFADRKEVFSIADLRDFYKKGLDVLSEGDLELIKLIEEILNHSVVFDNEVKFFLLYTYVHDLDLEKLKSIVYSFTQKKLFLSSDNYTELSKIHTNLKLISLFNEKQTADKMPYHELKQLYNGIIDSGLKFETSKIQKALEEAELWADTEWQKFNNIKILTTMTDISFNDHINPKFTLNTKFVEKIQWLSYKSEYSLSIDDKFEDSSAILSRNEEQADPKYYCVCREYEHGTMVECEECREWYHVQCVKDISNHKADVYKCPVCLLLSSGQDEDKLIANKLTLNEVIKTYDSGQSLRAVPINEVTLVGELANFLKAYRDTFNIDEILIEQNDQIRLEKLTFVLRKLYGCGLHIDDLFMKVLQHARCTQKSILNGSKQIDDIRVSTVSGDETEPELEQETNEGANLLQQENSQTAVTTLNEELTINLKGNDKEDCNEVSTEDGTIGTNPDKRLNFVFYTPARKTTEADTQNGYYNSSFNQDILHLTKPSSALDNKDESLSNALSIAPPPQIEEEPISESLMKELVSLEHQKLKIEEQSAFAKPERNESFVDDNEGRMNGDLENDKLAHAEESQSVAEIKDDSEGRVLSVSTN